MTGAHGRSDARLIAGAALAFGVLAALAATMPSIALEVPVVAMLGASAVTFAAAINSSLQLAVEPEMRGRVMALYSVVFLGSTPIGGPLAGWLSEAYDPRVALLLAAAPGSPPPGRRTSRFARMRARPRGAPPAPRRSRSRLAGEAFFFEVLRRHLLRRFFFEFDPGVELLHHLQRQAFLDLEDRLFVVGPGFFGDRLAGSRR